MQTKIAYAGHASGISQSLRVMASGVIKSVNHRISRISERTLMGVSMSSAALLIIFAGRYSATGAMSDFVMTAVTSMTALLAIAISSSRQEGGEK